MSNAELPAACKRHLAFKIFLKRKGWKFRYDVVRNRLMLRNQHGSYQQLNDKLLLDVIRSEFGSMSLEYMGNTLMSPYISPLYNPLKHWLSSLKYDDKIDHILEICNYIVLDNPTAQERHRIYIALKKWFVGAVKTLYDPYYVHKQAIILQGPSGIGKTPFIQSLLPNKFVEFTNYISSMQLGSKDAKIALTSSFIINLDEIDDFFKTKSNRDAYKSFVTQKYVNVRPPYGRTETSRQRIASFIGSCNESTFLNDPTGSQRFTIFSIEKLCNRRYRASKFVEEFPISLVWAQAYALYKSGYDPEYTHEELMVNEQANEIYKYNSPEYDTIIQFMALADKQESGAKFMTTTEICAYLNAQQDSVKFFNRTLGRALVRLRYKRVSKKINGQSIYGYYVRFLHEEETKWSSVITPKTLNKF